MLPRDTFNKDVWGDCDSFLRESFADMDWMSSTIWQGALVVGWYRRSPWNDEELVEQLRKKFNRKVLIMEPTMRDLLNSLGGPGLRVLQEWERRRNKREAKLSNPKPKQS